MNLAGFEELIIQQATTIWNKQLPGDMLFDLRPFTPAELQSFVENRLTDRQREAVCLRFADDGEKTYGEISEKLGVSKTRARELVVSSVRKAMQEFMDEETYRLI